MSCKYDIALVSCVKSKQPSRAPARDLYTSALFTKMKAYAELHANRWFILSAKFGLVNPDTIIEPYEQTLNTAKLLERRAWANHVQQQMQAAGLLSGGPSILWLAGRKYMDELQPLLTGCTHSNPMAGMQIGHRLKWLTMQIAAHDS